MTNLEWIQKGNKFGEKDKRGYICCKPLLLWKNGK